MPTFARESRPGRALRLFLAMAALACGLAWVGEASARTAAKPGHHCACRDACRGDSCCCSHEPDEAPAAEVRSTPAAPLSCVDRAPCSGGEAPTIPAGTSAPKAMLTRAFSLAMRGLGGAIAVRPPTKPVSPAPSRMDDPPDHAG